MIGLPLIPHFLLIFLNFLLLFVMKYNISKHVISGLLFKQHAHHRYIHALTDSYVLALCCFWLLFFLVTESERARERERERERERQRQRQRQRQTDRQTDRQTVTQTDRQTGRQTERRRRKRRRHKASHENFSASQIKQFCNTRNHNGTKRKYLSFYYTNDSTLTRVITTMVRLSFASWLCPWSVLMMDRPIE